MNDRPKQKRQRWRIVFAVLVCLALAYGAYRYVLQRMVEAKLDEIRRQGYPVTLAELDKWYVWPPAGENAADVYMEAFKHYHDWDDEKRKALPVVGSAGLPPRGQPMSEEMKQLIAAYLADNERALALLHKAAALKHCRFPLELTRDWSVIGTNYVSRLKHVRQGARLLALQALIAVEDADRTLATEALRSLFGLTRSLATEPMLISELTRFACNGVGADSLEGVLARGELTEWQLQKLADVLAGADSLEPMTRALVGERCIGNHYFDLRADWRLLFTEKQPLLGRAALNALLTLRGLSGLAQIERLHYLDLMAGNVRAATMDYPERFKAAKQVEEQATRLSRLFSLTRMAIVALSPLLNRQARHDATIRTARTALAVERYRLANEKLPVTLDEVVPAYLEAVPADPFDGRPLRYKRLERGYVVYSIGEDGEDNAGRQKDDKGRMYRPGTDIAFTVER